MKTSRHLHDGGAYRRMKTMVSYHAKPGEESFLSAAEAIRKLAHNICNNKNLNSKGS